MKRTKILYIHHGKGLGGAPLSLLYLIKGLDQSRYHPVVLFLHDSEAMELYRREGIEVEGPVNRSDFSHTAIWWYRWYHPHHLLKSLWDTAMILRREAAWWFAHIKPDIVHLNTSSLLAWGIVARRRGIPVIWHVREPLASGYLGLRRWLVTRSVARYATRILPISHHDAAPWRMQPHVQVVHNAVDLQRFDRAIDPQLFLEKYNLDPITPKILFVGGLSYEKGTPLILQVFTKLLHHLPNAQLLIAGYFHLPTQQSWKQLLSPTHRYAALVKELIKPIEASIKFLGPIHQMPMAMAASNVVVFPATIGHFARPIIEASCMAKPVVASKLSPLDELVVDGVTGYLVAPDDIDDWTRLLLSLLVDPALSSRLGEAGYQRGKELFGTKAMIKKIDKIYRELL